jgi:hypothetical protein
MSNFLITSREHLVGECYSALASKKEKSSHMAAGTGWRANQFPGLQALDTD